MPETGRSRSLHRQSGSERVFTDEHGRLWTATLRSAPGDGAVVFACISDSRQTVRAIAVDDRLRMRDVADETLRAWLRDAPRIGRLS